MIMMMVLDVYRGWEKLTGTPIHLVVSIMSRLFKLSYYDMSVDLL